MDPVILSEAECSSGGLQMLLDRWRLQEDKLQVFEESLKEVNKSMIYQPVQENLEASKPETVLQRTISVLGEDELGKSVQDGIFFVTTAQIVTSIVDDFGHSLRRGSNEEEDIEIPVITNEESIEEYEKWIWGTVWKDEVLLNDDSVEGSYPCVVEAAGTSSENYLQRASSEMARLPEVALVENDLQSAVNAEEKELGPGSLFQLDFEGLSVRASHLTSISNDVFVTSDLEVRSQSSIRLCSENVGMSHSFERDRRIGTVSLEDLGIKLENRTCPLACEEVESLEMAVNLVSPGSWSSSLSNEEFSAINELSKQRASFVESIMASEAQRQMEREKEQLRRNEALKQEEEAVANMERALQNQLQLVQEEKHGSIEQQECLRQKRHEQDRRLEELQRELESSNAVLKKLTENWESFGKEVEHINSESVEEYFKSKRLEEERRNTAAQRIARAFRKWRCRILYNYCTSIQKAVRGFLCRRRVQKLKGQRCKVMRVLAAAVEVGNLSMLIESSAEAQKVGLHKELDLMKLEFARRRVARLHVSDETFQSQSSPQVQALLMEAKSMGLEEGKLKELFKLTARCRNAALEHLTQVAEVGSRDEYESCLETALALGLEEQVDAIQERWEAAKAEVSGWLRQVASSWGTRLRAVSEKVEEARRLGLTTLVETVQATVAEKENNLLAGLEISLTNGSLRTFHEWLRSAKLFDMREVVEEYSARFRQRVSEVQKQVMQATGRSYEEKSLKQLLFEGSGLGLETEMAIVVRHIRRQILMFVKELVNHTRQSISRGDDFLGKWRELHWRGKGFGIGADALKDLLQSIENSVLLEHTKIRRSIVAVFKFDLTGFPVSHNREIRRAFINVKALALGCSASNSSSEAHEPARKQCPEIRTESGTRPTMTVPLVTHSISWHEVDKLRGRWKHQYSQPFLKMLASRSPAGGGLGIAKPQRRDREGLRWQSSEHYTRETMYVRAEEEIIEEVVVLDRGSEDGDGDDEYWHTPRSTRHRGVQPLATCTLTRKMLEVSAHCNRTELRGIVKLSITHKDLTSLGVGILGRWCPKLRIFMIDENRLNTLKGAFHGCEGLLEYVLVKDNLLNDFKGLESLQNLKVLFLGGNFISYIGPGTEIHMGDPEVVDGTVEAGPIAKTSTTTPRASCRSWQGTPRFLDDRTDPGGCLTSRNSHAQRARSPWPKLKKLCLGNNRIARVWELGSLCPNLEVLDLGSNELVTLGGCEGRGLAGLKNLRLLDVGQNKIKGRSLWKALSHCPLLVSLVASRNRLTELPTHLGSVMLREIWLNGNSITRLACKAWLPNLQRVYLQDNLIDNLESFWGCPSLEVLDISFNNVADLSQLNHLSCLRRLRTLQMNDNPVSDQEEHVDKVLEAVPWLIELDNEPVEDSFREKSVKSIFLKNMEVAGIGYLYEKAAQAEKLFLSFGNPKDVARQWLGGSSSFSDRYDWTCSAATSRHWANTKSEAVDRDIIEVMHGKAKGAILWAALFDLHRMAGTNLILRAQLTSPMGSSLYPLESLPCYSTTDENWNCLAFQEMFESHRKSHLWSKETSLRKEFLVQESKFGSPTTEKGVSNFGKDDVMAESHNVDQYLTDHLEYTDCTYQNLYKENVEYRTEIEAQLSRVRRLQALARGMLARKSRMRMQKLAVDALVAREAQRLSEKRCQSSVLRIQAAWRRRIFRKSVRSATKLQAYWRGFVIRKRFRQVLSRLRYVDDDDFEYVAVDENEFELDPILLEDEYSLVSKLRASKELGAGNLCKPETSSSDEIPAIGSENEYHGPSLSGSHGTRLLPSVNKQDGEMETVAALSGCQRSHIQIQCEETEAQSQSIRRGIDSCSRPYLSKRFDALELAPKPFIGDVSDSLSPREAEASAALQSKDSKSSPKETPESTSQPQLRQFPTESGPRAHICGKELRAEKMKASIAEIAKDWGFKNEKTAETFLKSKAKLLKKLEKEKATHQGAQSRLDLFKARSKEALAHSTRQHTHFKKAAPRQSFKVEKETVPIPSEDVSLADETLESRHPPAALPALIPNVRQAHLKKGKLRKSCPAAWAPSSTGMKDDTLASFPPGKFAMEVRDYVPNDETISWDGWQSWRPEANAHVGHQMSNAGDTKDHHLRVPFRAVFKKGAAKCRR